MIREKQTYPKVKNIKPLFWKECRFCGKEFKREGYSIEDYTQINARLYMSYCCGKCGKDIEEVKRLVDISKIRKIPKNMKTPKQMVGMK